MKCLRVMSHNNITARFWYNTIVTVVYNMASCIWQSSTVHGAVLSGCPEVQSCQTHPLI